MYAKNWTRSNYITLPITPSWFFFASGPIDSSVVRIPITQRTDKIEEKKYGATTGFTGAKLYIEGASKILL